MTVECHWNPWQIVHMIRYHSRGTYQLTWPCSILGQKDKYTAVYFRDRQSNARIIIIRFTLYLSQATVNQLYWHSQHALWWNGLTLPKRLKLVMTKIYRKRMSVIFWVLYRVQENEMFSCCGRDTALLISNHYVVGFAFKTLWLFAKELVKSIHICWQKLYCIVLCGETLTRDEARENKASLATQFIT